MQRSNPTKFITNIIPAAIMALTLQGCAAPDFDYSVEGGGEQTLTAVCRSCWDLYAPYNHNQPWCTPQDALTTVLTAGDRHGGGWRPPPGERRQR